MDGHLGDMLQQLHSVNASKPSERVLVRQGEPCRALGLGQPGVPGDAREGSARSAGGLSRPLSP